MLGADGHPSGLGASGFTYLGNAGTRPGALSSNAVLLQQVGAGGILSSQCALPASVLSVVRDLQRLIPLRDDWDSYGARPLRFDAVVGALEVLLSVLLDETPAPIVVPTIGGGVQLEWHRNGVDLEIDVISQQKCRVYFSDSRAGTDWEDTVTSDLTSLVAAIQAVSR